MTMQSAPQKEPKQGLTPGILGTADIIFMILACAAPMGVMAGLIPLALAFGNGVGMPGTQLGICVVMLLFSIGYVRMLPHIRNAGAFYAYIAASLNKEAGLAAAYTAVVAYICAATSVIGALCYFTTDFFSSFLHLAIRWEIWAAIYIAIIAWLGFRKITMAVKVLTIALLLEVLVILVICVMILWEKGITGLDFTSFSPEAIIAPGLGISVIYALNGCVGFEATAIYQEEAKDRNKTIPRATYGAVLLLGSFYVLATWCIILALTPEKVSEVAAADPGRLLTNISEQYLGALGRDALHLLTITSLFAAALGFFNNITRYFFALARDGVVPAKLGEVHPVHGSPYIAGMALTAIFTIVVGAFAVAGLDPLLNLTTSLSSMGAVGLMVLLTITSLCIPIFFLKRREISLGKVAAPLIAGILFAIATYLSLTNYSALTGTDIKLVNQLPWLFLFTIAIGWLHGAYIRRRQPDIYLRIGSTQVDEK